MNRGSPLRSGSTHNVSIFLIVIRLSNLGAFTYSSYTVLLFVTWFSSVYHDRESIDKEVGIDHVISNAVLDRALLVGVTEKPTTDLSRMVARTNRIIELEAMFLFTNHKIYSVWQETARSSRHQSLKMWVLPHPPTVRKVPSDVRERLILAPHSLGHLHDSSSLRISLTPNQPRTQQSDRHRRSTADHS